MPDRLVDKGFVVIISTLTMAIFLTDSGSNASTASITVIGQKPGITPFLATINLSATNPAAIASIGFIITPKPGSVTRPLSATFSASYLAGRGYLNNQTGQIELPIFGLYSNYSNTVVLSYLFTDGSSQQSTVVVITPLYIDPCGFANPVVLQARAPGQSLSYDYVLIKSQCSPTNSPTIIDTDGAIRWVGTAGIVAKYGFFDNAVYLDGSGDGTGLSRNDLDGSVQVLARSYKGLGVAGFTHNIDRGKTGMILDATTKNYAESMNIELDKDGKVLKKWDLASTISAAVTAGGDNPAQFVYPAPADWFHNNSVCYRASDNSLIVSSREDFVIALDYDTGAIKWILGDPTKKWYQFPSLRRYALTLAPGSVPPIGQHSVSITSDDNLLLFDNGTASFFQVPPGATRPYSAPRKYHLDLSAKTATEVWNFTRNQSVKAAVCSSIYEDQSSNYVVDYAYRKLSGGTVAEILGINSAGQTVFDYAYPAQATCDTAWNSLPVHLENLNFGSAPTPTPKPTPTPTATPTVTPKPTPTPTATPTVTPRPTPTPTPTATPLPSGSAVMLSPVPGSTLTSSQVTFNWSAGNATTYLLLVGSSPRGFDIYYSTAVHTLSATVSNIPADGRTIYVTLGSQVAGVWVANSYTYKAP